MYVCVGGASFPQCLTASEMKMKQFKTELCLSISFEELCVAVEYIHTC